MRKTLFSRNFILLMAASTLGAIGGIAGSYALSFMVFDETGSTLATGVVASIQILPHFMIPVLIAPLMDRLPRKPFLVYGDLLGGILYGLAGLYLRHYSFSYVGYLAFSLLINSVNAFDSLAFNCIFPKTIPEGFEDKGYTVSSMLYPVLNVLMMPVAAVLMDSIGVGNILLMQSILSFAASVTENAIIIDETNRFDVKKSGLSLWWKDFKDGWTYLKGERGLCNIFAYDAVANGSGTGFGPILVAFFRTAPGYSATMYAFFSAAEFIGRSIDGVVRYTREMKPEKRGKFVYFVQQFYNFMDMILLWLPYPLMLVNRGICGFLGINSATVRASSVHQYLPDEYRARVNAFTSAWIYIFGSLASIIFGAMGELLDYRTTMTGISFICIFLCWFTVGRNHQYIQKIYLNEK